MSEGRRVVKRNKGTLIAIPASVRDALELLPGEVLYWHVVRKRDEAVLSKRAVRVGGRPLPAECSECEHSRSEAAAARAKLQSVRDAAFHHGMSVRFAKESGVYVELRRGFAAMERRFAELASAVGAGRGPVVLARRSRRSRPVQVVDSPALSSPSSLSTGGADASGGSAPQASHAEMSGQEP